MEEIKISKELLSEVYTGKYIILGTVWIEGDNIRFRSLNNCSISNKINKYKFAYMCKEWALRQGYYFSIYSFNFSDNTEQEHRIRLLIGNDIVYSGNDSCQESEVEAIFKACQWILDTRKI